MPPRPLDHLPDQIVIALLEKIAPDSHPTQVELLPGSFSNHTHVVEACLPDGSPLKCVVHRYQDYGEYSQAEKARREYKAFELMNRRGIPSPELLLLDDSGAILGVPGIVEGFADGTLMLETPADPVGWARQTAAMLAQIHSMTLTDDDRSILLDANWLAVWFLRHPGDRAPEYMSSFPGGEALWQTIGDLYAQLQPDTPVLIHGDFWEGNLLWSDGKISAVLDWEEAGYGDPAVDVAYAVMNLYLRGLPEAAETFLRAYEAQRGQKLRNLPLWELAAAVRPLVAPVDWQLAEDHHQARLLEFIASARRDLGC